ncbi:MAG: Phosphopantothenate synthetase [Candidatus Methanohalarchaeum thermophilum]|uniref:4-phosphopantoate--beta-alanine ligase n=1 Tax=Methanohalarchaeum thermophilum TaxID=1903181 RepID=A0A1Q6DXG3_METT1|nr:MAG: Phosphopantothenate synthetase [Candidatus Methanohalarchaeum thermophilum]
MKGTAMDIPDDHPRARSLEIREKLEEGYKSGLVTEMGLIAHGRGEAFDYLIDEKTIKESVYAIKVASKILNDSQNPVISVNGNTAALVPKVISDFTNETGINVEVNLFHRTEDRVRKIIKFLKEHGAGKVLGRNPGKRIPDLSHKRALVTKEGIYEADTVVVPLEDGDRTEKLIEMGKKVISIDLNPRSRTAQESSVTIVDNVVRAMPKLFEFYKEEPDVDIDEFDNEKNLEQIEAKIRRNKFGKD